MLALQSPHTTALYGVGDIGTQGVRVLSRRAPPGPGRATVTTLSVQAIPHSPQAFAEVAGRWGPKPSTQLPNPALHSAKAHAKFGSYLRLRHIVCQQPRHTFLIAGQWWLDAADAADPEHPAKFRSWQPDQKRRVSPVPPLFSDGCSGHHDPGVSGVATCTKSGFIFLRSAAERFLHWLMCH